MYDIDSLPGLIELGHLNEKGVCEIEFDVTDWLADYPLGVLSITYIRPGETDVYPADGLSVGTVDDTDILTWTVSNAVTAIAGSGSVVITLTEGETIVKRSDKVQTIVMDGHAAAGDPPEPLADYVQKWSAVGATVTESVPGTAPTAEVTQNEIGTHFAFDLPTDLAADALATTLETGEPATAEVTQDETGAHFAFGLPRGLTGAQGIQGIQGEKIASAAFDGNDILLTMTDDSTVRITGGKTAIVGATGNGIASIVRTAGNGLPGTVDTYTITFDDGTMQTYDVAHGVQGIQGIQGLTGNGIASVTLTDGNHTPGTTDTYTVTFTDESITTFDVYNGANGDITGVTVDGAEVTPSNGVVDLTESFERYALWRKTSSANPVSVYPVPESPLYPKVSGTFTRAGMGDPSPENIRLITPWLANGATAKVKRTGKNLANVADFSSGHYATSGWVNSAVFFGLKNNLVYLVAGTTYYGVYFNETTQYLSNSFQCVDLLTMKRTDEFIPASGRATISKSGYYSIRFYNAGGFPGMTDGKVMICDYGLGTNYEPYYGSEEITLTAPQEIPAGWMDNEGKGQVTWAKKVFDGTESVQYDTSNARFYLTISPLGVHNTPLALNCSHYVNSILPISTSDRTDHVIIFYVDRFYWRDLGFTNSTDMKAYLAAQYAAGTPVTVVYQLATPVALTPAIAPLTALPQLDRITPRQNVLTATPASGIELTYAKSPIQESIDVAAAIV